MDKLKDLKAWIETAEDYGTKFYRDKNKGAGAFLRNSLLQIRKISTELRKDVQDELIELNR